MPRPPRDCPDCNRRLSPSAVLCPGCGRLVRWDLLLRLGLLLVLFDIYASRAVEVIHQMLR